MEISDNTRYALQRWMSKNFKGEKLPSSAMELHYFINDVEYEFRGGLQDFSPKTLQLFIEDGILTEDKRLTLSARLVFMKLFLK